MTLTACNQFFKDSLNTPSNLHVEENILYWDEVDNARSYYVVINNTTYITSNTFYDLKELDMGIYYIKIKARGVGYSDSKYSEIYTYLVYEKPELNIDGYMLTWTKINNASKYHLYINDVDYVVNDNQFDLSQLTINNFYQITLTTFFDNYETEKTDVIEFPYFQIPDNLQINDGILTWDDIKDCDKYTIFINEDMYNADKNQYDLSSLPEKNIFDIKVVAHYGEYQSDYSKVIKYHTYKDHFTSFYSINDEMDFRIDLQANYSDITLFDSNDVMISNENYYLEGQELCINQTYLSELPLGDNLLKLKTTTHDIIIKITIFDKPYIKSSNKVKYTGTDIEFLFELFDGTISLPNSMTENDYIISGNKLIIKKEYIGRELVDKKKNEIIISYILQSSSNIVLGFICIEK